MPIPLLIFLPLLAALFLPLAARAGRGAVAGVAALASLAVLAGLITAAPQVMSGSVIASRTEWLPALGLDLSFRLDGLGLLFAILISGIGFCVIVYAHGYMPRDDRLDRFMALILGFQTAMLGIVLAGNVLILLMFWEATSLLSFLLIGYWPGMAEARRGARMSLAVTGGGGLVLIAGMLLLGRAAGSMEFSEILARRDAVQASTLYIPALVLILIGAFAKSAQFPLHFWLAKAMVAPTPVSAYLHSATMVKAGVFLMARLWPVLAGTGVWHWAVGGAGIATFVLGAALALTRSDLKAILAGSTVSHLGIVTFLLGVGTQAAAAGAMLHVLNHAVFKAALFMVAGIVTHAAHARDLGKLGGLGRAMPFTAATAVLAGLSMAGVPPFGGFLSKEMLLEAALTQGPVVIAVVTLGAGLSVAYTARFVWGIFGGPRRSGGNVQEAGVALLIPAAGLACLALAFGLAPGVLAEPLTRAAASVVTGGLAEVHLTLWHGVTPALTLSAIALAGGVTLFLLRRGKDMGGVPLPDAASLYDRCIAGLVVAARGLTRASERGLRTGLIVMTIATGIGGFWAFMTGAFEPGTRAALDAPPTVVAGWAMLVGATLALTVLHRHRFLSLVLVGVVGLMVSLGFLFLSAPDLALTQIVVEVVMVLLMLLALRVLPHVTPAETPAPARLGLMTVAVAGGIGIGVLAYAMLTRDLAAFEGFARLSDYYLRESVPGGGGANVVNVILVDFRGFDTYGEISVLGIAGVTVVAIARLLPERAAQEPPGDLLFATVARGLLPLALVVGLHIFLRGHNTPGGGFVAGLVVSVAVLIHAIATGAGPAPRTGERLVAGGLATAGVTGLAAWVFGMPFLTSAYGHWDLPVVGSLELASAMGFDAGVFMTVLGATMLAIGGMERLTRRVE